MSISIIDSLDRSIGFENFVFLAVFLVLFAFLFFIFGRIFRNQMGESNKGIAGTISFAFSAIATYGMYKIGFNLTEFFYDLGVGEGLIYTIVSLILIIGAFLLIKKIGFSNFLLAIGLLFILIVAFTDFIYEETTIIVTGFILFFIGLLLKFLFKKNKQNV